MNKELNIENWARKEHFNFFNSFEEPFFGITAAIDCSVAYQKCKERNHSFFLYYLHKSLVAAIGIEPFRYRISENKVFIYEEIHASATINRPDGTFGFSFMKYAADFNDFSALAKEEIARVQQSKGLMPEVKAENVIHYSSMPWINFTSISHARSFSIPDSCPKITFGQMTTIGNKRSMPVDVHANHALMDGLHVSQFFDAFQKLMNE
jgi:chloramphenicol O-acetyltransferase type A